MKWKFRTILMICNNGELNSSLLSPNFVVFCTEFKTAKWHYGLLTLVGGIVGGFWRSRLGRDVSTVFSLSRWFPYKCWFFDFLLGILYLKTNGGSHLFLLFLRIQNKNPWFFDLFFLNVSFEKVKLVLLVSSMLIFWWVKLTLKIDCQVTKDKRCFIANKEICGWGELTEVVFDLRGGSQTYKLSQSLWQYHCCIAGIVHQFQIEDTKICSHHYAKRGNHMHKRSPVVCGNVEKPCMKKKSSSMYVVRVPTLLFENLLSRI